MLQYESSISSFKEVGSRSSPNLLAAIFLSSICSESNSSSFCKMWQYYFFSVIYNITYKVFSWLSLKISRLLKSIEGEPKSNKPTYLLSYKPNKCFVLLRTETLSMKTNKNTRSSRLIPLRKPQSKFLL